MLEICDIQRLFSHLREVHHNCPPDKIPRLTNGLAKVWVKAFEGYSYQQVEEAIDRRAAVNRFWPDASEVKAFLPPLPERASERGGNSPSAQAASDWLAEVGRDYHARLKVAGYPTLAEARAQGMTCAEWMELTKEIEML